ncbi:MAG TPA: polymer-forming cytoskeletal protein [Tissierellaceae bacterium]|nr:polymer-forming cytoskeletal protein [Tissierellaceae bacterium]
MFRRKDQPTEVEDVDTLIGENIKITGKLEGVGNIRLDGSIDGDINYEGNIIIGETGRVKGNIVAESISVAGYVKGNIVSDSKLTLLPKASLIGDVEVSSFVIHENARFEGNCKMMANMEEIDREDE